jgi:hypothetical protein
LAAEFRKDNVVARDSHAVRSWSWDSLYRIGFDDGNSHTFATRFHSQPADLNQTCTKLYFEYVLLIAQSISDRRRGYRGKKWGKKSSFQRAPLLQKYQRGSESPEDDGIAAWVTEMISMRKMVVRVLNGFQKDAAITYEKMVGGQKGTGEVSVCQDKILF